MRLCTTVPVPDVFCEFRPIRTPTPFWQPLNGVSRIWAMWLSVISAEPPLSTRTPYSMLSHGPPPGPVTVKWRSVTLCAPLTVTIAFGETITGGALITAARSGTEKSVSPSLPAGMLTCSTYVPAQTLIIAPGGAAVTALWIVVNCAFGQLRWSSSTISMFPDELLELAWGPAVDSSDDATPIDDRSVPRPNKPVSSGGSDSGALPTGPTSYGDA